MRNNNNNNNNWMVRVMLSYFSPAPHRFNLAAQVSFRKEPRKCSIWSFDLDVGSVFLLAVKKAIFTPVRRSVLSSFTVLLVLKSGHLIANQIWEFCNSYDYNDNTDDNWKRNMRVFELMPSSPTHCKRTAKVKARPERRQYDNSYFRYASDEVLYNDLYTDVSKKGYFALAR